MRKIEQDMLKAIRDRRDWQSGNTAVVVSPWQNGNPDYMAHVELHGHPIAYIKRDGTMLADTDTFERWTTNTTASRLRALGFGASIRCGKPHLERTQIRNQED